MHLVKWRQILNNNQQLLSVNRTIDYKRAVLLRPTDIVTSFSTQS